MLLIQIDPVVNAYVRCDKKRCFEDEPVPWERLSDLGVRKTAKHTYELGEHRVSYTIPARHSESLDGHRPLFHLGKMLAVYTHYHREEGLKIPFEKWVQMYLAARGIEAGGLFRHLGGVFRTHEGGVLLAYFAGNQLQLEPITETSVIYHLKVTTLQRMIELNWQEVEKNRAYIKNLHDQMLAPTHFTNFDLPAQLVDSGAVRFAGR